MTYRIRHQDGRWLKECEFTAFENRAWTIVPGWGHDGSQTVVFAQRVEAEALAGALKQRGFPVEVVECP